MGVRAKGKWESVGVSAERGSSVTTEGGGGGAEEGR